MHHGDCDALGMYSVCHLIAGQPKNEPQLRNLSFKDEQDEPALHPAVQGHRKMNPFCIPFSIHNMGGALLAMDLGFMGPNYPINTACATGNYCLLRCSPASAIQMPTLAAQQAN